VRILRAAGGAAAGAAALLTLGLLALSASAPAPAGSLRSRFEAGNDAYERGDFREAAGIYREIGKAGARSAALHYNLGNALFKDGKLGEAILEYERAARLSPGDDDVRENLAYLRSLTVDEITPAASPLSALGITFLLALTTPGQEAALMLGAWLAAGAAFGAGLAARSEGFRRTAFYAAGALLVPALLAGAALGTESWIAGSAEQAIVLAAEAEVLSGAGSENPTLFTVHEGLKVRIRGRAPGWLQVSLENGLSGWLPDGSVAPI